MNNPHIEIRTDEDLKAEVVEQLRWDDRVDASRVQVTVIDRLVTLEGSVGSEEARTAAGDAASMIRGVLAITNRLVVEPAGSSTRATDEDLEEGIRKVYSLDSVLDEGDIAVGVKEGVVTLEGSVPSYWKKSRAQELVAGFGGILEIHNRLSVVPTEKHEDQALALDVTSALERHGLVDTETVTVEAAEGVVTLIGTVPDWHAFTAASRTASHTAGVVDVHNRLVVYP